MIMSRGEAAIRLLRAATVDRDFPGDVPDTPQNRQLWNSIHDDLHHLPDDIVVDIPHDQGMMPEDTESIQKTVSDDVSKRIWNPLNHPRGAHGQFGLAHAGEFGAVGTTGMQHSLHLVPAVDFTHLENVPAEEHLDVHYIPGPGASSSLAAPKNERLSAAWIGPPRLSYKDTKASIKATADAHPEIFAKGTKAAVHNHKGEKRFVRLGTSLALAATIASGVGHALPEDQAPIEVPDPGPTASEFYNNFHDVEDKDDPFYIGGLKITGASPKAADSAAHTVIEYIDDVPWVQLEKDWIVMTEAEKEAFLTALLEKEEEAESSEKSAETPELSSTHRPLGTHGLWGDRTAQLPAYIQNIAHALIRDGHDESSAISIAVGRVKAWAAGEGSVTPEVQAASAKAVLEWEKLKAEHSGGGGGGGGDRGKMCE